MTPDQLRELANSFSHAMNRWNAFDQTIARYCEGVSRTLLWVASGYEDDESPKGYLSQKLLGVLDELD